MSAPALLPAVQAATRVPHDVTARLYTDGATVRWLPRPLPGWYRLGAVVVKSARRAA